jgi:hypothetical protein
LLPICAKQVHPLTITQKKELKDAKETVVNLKHRVLDLFVIRNHELPADAFAAVEKPLRCLVVGEGTGVLHTTKATHNVETVLEPPAPG